MLTGYKGFIAIIALFLNEMGFVDYGNEDVQKAITVGLTILVFLFRLLTKLRMKKAGVK